MVSGECCAVLDVVGGPWDDGHNGDVCARNAGTGTLHQILAGVPHHHIWMVSAERSLRRLELLVGN